jgi:microcystin-dependent protein
MAGPSGSTPTLHLPYPIQDDNVDVPRDIKALADALDPLSVVPVGAMMMWPTGVAPVAWLLLNGAQVDQATYPLLAPILGASSGKITLPDMRGRFPVGPSASQVLGSSGGAERVGLTSGQSGIPGDVKTGLRDRAQTHIHGNTLASAGVTNGAPGSAGKADWGVPTIGYYGNQVLNVWNAFIGFALSADVPDHQHYTIATDAPETHENRPPYVTVNFIIRAK